MPLAQVIFPSEYLNSYKTINISGITYLSKPIFKFLKNNECKWDKVSFKQNVQILKK